MPCKTHSKMQYLACSQQNTMQMLKMQRVVQLGAREGRLAKREGGSENLTGFLTVYPLCIPLSDMQSLTGVAQHALLPPSTHSYTQPFKPNKQASSPFTVQVGCSQCCTWLTCWRTSSQKLQAEAPKHGGPSHHEEGQVASGPIGSRARQQG